MTSMTGACLRPRTLRLLRPSSSDHDGASDDEGRDQEDSLRGGRPQGGCRAARADSGRSTEEANRGASSFFSTPSDNNRSPFNKTTRSSRSSFPRAQSALEVARKTGRRRSSTYPEQSLLVGIPSPRPGITHKHCTAISNTSVQSKACPWQTNGPF